MTEHVSVPVPVDRVQEVYELLARQPSVRPFDRMTTPNGDSGEWSQVLIERMFHESSLSMRRILRAVAQASPGWVTTKEIAIAAGLTARQVVASLGPFEKRVRGRYAMNRWPFEAREFVDSGVSKYSMRQPTAGWILELDGEDVQARSEEEE